MAKSRPRNGTSIPDLTPRLDVKVEVTPVAILRQQATYLEQHTGGLIVVDVQTSQDPVAALPPPEVGRSAPLSGTPVPRVSHQFVLIAPLLNNYRYTLLVARHSLIAWYPVVLQLSSGAETTADTQKQFEEQLRKALGSDHALAVLTSLIQQSTGQTA
ncbi:MAG: hypothetical protein AB7K09_15470 [Planctomycetota bacterium]